MWSSAGDELKTVCSQGFIASGDVWFLCYVFMVLVNPEGIYTLLYLLKMVFLVY